MCILVDPFFSGVPGVAGRPAAKAADIPHVNLILITHDHWDHFSEREITAAVRATGAVVAGPASVISRLKGCMPAAKLREMEPPAPGRGEKCRGITEGVCGAAVTGFRTHHGRAHNSYLVEMEGFRFFHDGDNEKTDILDRRFLMNLDAIMICPWQGSGWVAFLDVLAPRYWFLMHMTDEELDAHDRGAFFPDLCDHIPAGLVALRPGQLFRQESQ